MLAICGFSYYPPTIPTDQVRLYIPLSDCLSVCPFMHKLFSNAMRYLKTSYSDQLLINKACVSILWVSSKDLIRPQVACLCRVTLAFYTVLSGHLFLTEWEMDLVEEPIFGDQDQCQISNTVHHILSFFIVLGCGSPEAQYMDLPQILTSVVFFFRFQKSKDKPRQEYFHKIYWIVFILLLTRP